VDATVTVIDAARKTVLAREDFQGGEPPSVAPRGGGPGRGTKPLDKIVNYLQGLPREPAAS
jgi:hypothetical protein